MKVDTYQITKAYFHGISKNHDLLWSETPDGEIVETKLYRPLVGKYLPKLKQAAAYTTGVIPAIGMVIVNDIIVRVDLCDFDIQKMAEAYSFADEAALFNHIYQEWTPEPLIALGESLLDWAEDTFYFNGELFYMPTDPSDSVCINGNVHYKEVEAVSLYGTVPARYPALMWVEEDQVVSMDVFPISSGAIQTLALIASSDGNFEVIDSMTITVHTLLRLIKILKERGHNIDFKCLDVFNIPKILAHYQVLSFHQIPKMIRSATSAGIYYWDALALLLGLRAKYKGLDALAVSEALRAVSGSILTTAVADDMIDYELPPLETVEEAGN